MYLTAGFDDHKAGAASLCMRAWVLVDVEVCFAVPPPPPPHPPVVAADLLQALWIWIDTYYDFLRRRRGGGGGCVCVAVYAQTKPHPLEFRWNGEARYTIVHVAWELKSFLVNPLSSAMDEHPQQA